MQYTNTDEITPGYLRAKRILAGRMTKVGMFPIPGPLTNDYYVQGAYCMMCVLFKAGFELGRDDVVVSLSTNPFAERLAGFLGGRNPVRMERPVGGRPYIATPVNSDTFATERTIVVVTGVAKDGIIEHDAIKVLREKGAKKIVVVALVDNNEGARETLDKLGYQMYSVFTITELLEIGIKPPETKILTHV